MNDGSRRSRQGVMDNRRIEEQARRTAGAPQVADRIFLSKRIYGAPPFKCDLPIRSVPFRPPAPETARWSREVRVAVKPPARRVSSAAPCQHAAYASTPAIYGHGVLRSLEDINRTDKRRIPVLPYQRGAPHRTSLPMTAPKTSHIYKRPHLLLLFWFMPPKIMPSTRYARLNKNQQYWSSYNNASLALTR